MKIHQFVHTLNYGDAISGEAITIRRMLMRAGIESTIYSVNAHEKVKSETVPWGQFEADAAASAGEPCGVILHYSIASPLNDLFQRCSSAFRGIIYHNLTPEHWFLGYNARVVADLRKARAGLEQAVRSADLVLADSAFNLEEIRSFCRREPAVFPLVIDTEKWGLEANPGIAAALRGHGGKNILHVGRTAPNKSLEDILKVFYFYHHKMNKESRLWLVGSDVDTEIYSFELRQLAQELQIQEAVTFVGSVADSELKSFFQNADCYLCMSEHEGFCVPLIEAMHFGLPVIAYDAGAVKDTIGTAGIVVSEKRHALIAELLQQVLQDGALRGKLVEAGRRRVAEFGLSRFGERIEAQIAGPMRKWAADRLTK